MPKTAQNHVPPTYGAIERVLRDNILTGFWGPGRQLPTHHELLKKFGTSKATIQRALDRLIADGFVEACRGHGRFVSPRPPHLNDYALIFAGTPAELNWGGFSQTLSSSADAMARTGTRKLPPFYGIHGHTDSEDYQRLLHAIQRQRLAGLIFTTNPGYMAGDPLLELPGIPRVTVLPEPVDQFATAVVALDQAGFCNRAVDYLADRGRKRIAVLFHGGWGELLKQEDDFLLAMQRRGLVQEPYWRQYLNVFHPTGICRAVHLLMHAGQAQRPDALIIADDTMMDSAINGLFAAGIRVPQDLEVLGHANFPVKATPVPVKRLGFDSRRVLEACIGSIDAQRRGETVPLITSVPAVFDDEIGQTATRR